MGAARLSRHTLEYYLFCFEFTHVHVCGVKDVSFIVVPMSLVVGFIRCCLVCGCRVTGRWKFPVVDDGRGVNFETQCVSCYRRLVRIMIQFGVGAIRNRYVVLYCTSGCHGRGLLLALHCQRYLGRVRGLLVDVPTPGTILECVPYYCVSSSLRG